jgi:carbon monoxide dehydrogenase subunit G
MREIVRFLANPLRRMPAVFLCCLLALSGNVTVGAEPTATVTVEKKGEVFVVDATTDVQVSVETAWEVLTDFDHMASILGNLTSSKVIRQDGDTWIIRQEGVAKYGPLSFSFESEREVRLEPMKRILARNLSGTLKRMESEAKIAPLDRGVQITYHAEMVFDSFLAQIFGATFVRHEIEEQLFAVAREMLRRHPHVEPAGTALESPASGS